MEQPAAYTTEPTAEPTAVELGDHFNHLLTAIAMLDIDDEMHPNPTFRASMPQAHALIHLNPEDVAMVRHYLGEQLTHAGHRLVEDPSISRGGVRIDAAGSQIDATVQTRWRRIMDNLGRNIHWDGDGS